MRCFEKVASLLLPALAASLVIPADPLPQVRETAPEHLPLHVPTVEYGSHHGTILKFSLPCDECEEEEQRKLEEEVFTVSIPSSDERSCVEQDDTGIRVNGEALLAERVDLNGHRRWGHPSNLHFNTSVASSFDADWELTCGCLSDLSDASLSDKPCPEYGYTLALQLRLGPEKRNKPGFTLTFDQRAGSQLMRYSPFVEDISDVFDGVSMTSIHSTRHWKQEHNLMSKVAQPQPSATAILVSTPTTSALPGACTDRHDPTATVPQTNRSGAKVNEKEVRYYRFRLQEEFNIFDQGPATLSNEDRERVTQLIEKLEKLPDLERDVIYHTKINKMLKRIIKRLSDASDDDFAIKQRSQALYNSWEATLQGAAVVAPHDGSEHDTSSKLEVSTPGGVVVEPCTAPNVEQGKMIHPLQIPQSAQYVLGKLKSKFESFETHMAQNAQLLLNHLPGHTSYCHKKENLMQADLPEGADENKSTPTGQDGAMETRGTVSTNTGTSTPQIMPLEERTGHSMKALQITSGVFLLICLSAVLYACARRDPRLRVEIAARVEECRNIRLYRRAARRQRWINFVDWIRGTPSEKRTYLMPHSPDQTDFSEKGIAIMAEVSSDHSGVGKELSGIRKAHKFVEGLLKANGRTLGQSSGVIAGTSRHHRSYSDSGSEKSTPPAYGEHDEDIVIVDGLTFQSALPGESPDSSVVDTSSRHSCCGSSDYGKE